LALPLSAVRTDKPQPYVQMLNKDKVVHQTVRMGQRGHVDHAAAGEPWVVITDVPANSQVLTASVGSLREGANVRLISPAPGAPAATSAKP